MPIPPLTDPAGWRHVPIVESGERLVALSTWAPGRVAVDPRYHAQGYPAALPECYAREGVARQLQAAAATLPPGWQLVVFDAWRPLAVQQQLFDRYKAELRREHPAMSEEALEHAAQRYVALPSANPACPSPHATGGAVDLSLRDQAGSLLDVGTPFDAFDERSHTRYLERQLERAGAPSPREVSYLENRRLLFHTLARAGFTNYPEEWWHFEYGRSQYGPILTLDEGLRRPSPRPWEGGYWVVSPDALYCLPRRWTPGERASRPPGG